MSRMNCLTLHPEKQMNSVLNMCRPRSYKSTDKMSDLICENYALLQVLSRFGVSLGFGASRSGRSAR